VPDDDARCPCGTGHSYGDCCGPLHRGAAQAPTAEALMRSRFTAFATGDAAYLLATWHPRTRPAALELDPAHRWTRLEVLATGAGGPLDQAGTVEFRAHYRLGAERGSVHERSRFTRAGGAWRYLDGQPAGRP
jgi:SEC-C motif-containing protein